MSTDNYDIAARQSIADGRMMIATLEGFHHVDLGDYVIRGIAGEFYPCKPDIFSATYEPTAEEA